MMDSTVFENVRVWKSSITHELDATNALWSQRVATRDGVIKSTGQGESAHLDRVRRMDRVWDALKPHRRAILSADASEAGQSV
jgi:hypothetical protein